MIMNSIKGHNTDFHKIVFQKKSFKKIHPEKQAPWRKTMKWFQNNFEKYFRTAGPVKKCYAIPGCENN